jgi:ABC-type dipeptide/oligopeptide/nickel transport system permease subunit
VAPRPQGVWRLAWRRFRRDRVAVASAAFLGLLLFAIFPGATIASALLGHGPDDLFPYAVSVSLKPAGPLTVVPNLHSLPASSAVFSLHHPQPPPGTGRTILLLGADGSLGRDEFLRLLYGGRVSLEVAFGATALAALVGMLLGSVAAYFGGLIDGVISRLTDLAIAFPLLLFVIMVGATVSPRIDSITLHGLLARGVVSLVLLIGAFTWFYPARIVRSQVLSLRNRGFVEASSSLGARDSWVIRKHLLPHLAPPLIVYVTLFVATNILLEAGISFLGIGIKLPTASWGSLLSASWGTALSPQAYNPTTFQPWLTVLPSVSIFLTVLAVNMVGESLREAFDPGASN